MNLSNKQEKNNKAQNFKGSISDLTTFLLNSFSSI